MKEKIQLRPKEMFAVLHYMRREWEALPKSWRPEALGGSVREVGGLSRRS